jgi:transcriptional regulator with XRE-family HTH domain
MEDHSEQDKPLEFDTADRMRKSLRVSGLTVQDMADYLGVTRGTVSTWINGHISPSVQTLMLWAMKTGVPYEWLTGGAVGREPKRTAPARKLRLVPPRAPKGYSPNFA